MGSIIGAVVKLFALAFKALMFLLVLPLKLLVLPFKLIKLVKFVLPVVAGLAIFRALERRGQAIEGRDVTVLS